MRTLVLPLFFALLASGQTPGPLSPATPPPASAPKAAPAPVSPDTVVAEVDGKKITAADVEHLMALVPPQQAAAARADIKRAITMLLLMQHLSQEAEKANLDKQSPLKEQLEYNRLSGLANAEVNQVRNFDVKVEPAEQERFYKDHTDQFQEAKVKVIYVAFSSVVMSPNPEAGAKKQLSETEAKAKIEDLKKQLQGGADFSKLAKENSDDKASASIGGDFGVLKRSSPYPEAIKTAVFSLKAGQVSEPLKEKNGFYLFRLESLTVQPYEKVRTQIYDELKQKGFGDWMQALQKRYEVKVENPAYFATKPAAPPRLLQLAKELPNRLPEADGKPIRVRFRANLEKYWRIPVHAGSDLRKRRIFLDLSLETQPIELKRILIHELFHFAWLRLGNPVRDSYSGLLAGEFDRRVRGELGWSAEYRKDALRDVAPAKRDRARWREYVCESFCDTAAWFYSGIVQHDEFTLAGRHRNLRARWFVECFRQRKLLI